MDRAVFVPRALARDEDEIQNQLEACIRRYRYTGSFMSYVFRTLECAGRGIRPTRIVSFH